MLLLSRETGQPVRLRDGTPVGHVVDVTAKLAGAHPAVDRLAIGSHRAITHLVPWGDVVSFDHAGVVLTDATLLATTAVHGSLELDDEELLLRRDVLDTQVYDVGKRRMGRVADVVFSQRPNGDVEVVAVDVGFGRVVSRLGLRALGARLPTDAIDWSDLHLTSDRGHDIQLATPGSAVHRLDARGLAELVTRLDVERATDILDTVGPERAAEVVATTHPKVRRWLLSSRAGGGSHRTRRFSRLRGWRLYRPRADRSQPSDGAKQ